MWGGDSKFGTGGLIILEGEGGHPSTTPKFGGSYDPEGAQRRGRPVAVASIFIQRSSCCTPAAVHHSSTDLMNIFLFPRKPSSTDSMTD